MELLIADKHLPNIVNKGYLAPETLSSGNWHRLAMYQLMAFYAWEFLYYANQSESIPVNLRVGADA